MLKLSKQNNRVFITHVEWPKHFAVKWLPGCSAEIVYSAVRVELVQEPVAGETVQLLLAVVVFQLLLDLDVISLVVWAKVRVKLGHQGWEIVINNTRVLTSSCLSIWVWIEARWLLKWFVLLDPEFDASCWICIKSCSFILLFPPLLSCAIVLASCCFFGFKTIIVNEIFPIYKKRFIIYEM